MTAIIFFLLSNFSVPSFNISTDLFSDFSSNVFNPYLDVFGFMFWTFMFGGLITYAYIQKKDPIVIAVLSIVFFSIFAAAFYPVPELSVLFAALTALSITGLIYGVIIRGR